MIPVFRPSYDHQELDAIKEVLDLGWSGLGPKTQLFEERFAAYIGVKHAVGVNSCTAALHLALEALEIGGAEVITTPMTFVSTNHAILYNKGVPVFADIEEDTLNIDATKIEKLITPKTKGIVAVHYGGHACDMDAILHIAKAKNLFVLEDVAHGCGGEYKGRKLGSLGSMGCFSFHAVKNLSCGDGGMATVNDPATASRLKKMRWLGIDKDTWNRSETDKKYSWAYTVEALGFKCHMNDIAAAIGLVQLQKLDPTNQRRREVAHIYNKAFAGLSWLKTPVEKTYAKSSWHNYVVKVDEKLREKFMESLAAKGISTSVHYYPNHLYEMYKPYRRSLPVAEKVWKSIVTLPLFPGLTEEEVGRVVGAVLEFSKKA